MSPIHEIAFLVLSGSLGCWTWPAPENPCPNADTIKLAAYEKPDLQEKPLKYIDRKSFKSFVSTEVGYEENGFAIYKIENSEWYQIMSINDQKLWLHLPSIEKQFQTSLPTIEKQNNSISWRVEKIENLIGHGQSKIDGDYLKSLRKEDLKTPIVLSKDLLAELHEMQLQSILVDNKLELPFFYVEVNLSCTFLEVSPGSKKGSCKPAPKILVYKKPNESAPNTSISMSWANWVGKPISQFNQEKKIEHLFIFNEDKDWLKIQITFGNSDDRIRWIKKRDLKQYKIQTLPRSERISALIHILESSHKNEIATQIKQLSPEPSFSATGKTKWSAEGVLWGEINIQDFSACSGKEPKTLMKAWLPYKLDKKSKPVLSWYSRGC